MLLIPIIHTAFVSIGTASHQTAVTELSLGLEDSNDLIISLGKLAL